MWTVSLVKLYGGISNSEYYALKFESPTWPQAKILRFREMDYDDDASQLLRAIILGLGGDNHV